MIFSKLEKLSLTNFFAYKNLNIKKGFHLIGSN